MIGRRFETEGLDVDSCDMAAEREQLNSSLALRRHAGHLPTCRPRGRAALLHRHRATRRPLLRPRLPAGTGGANQDARRGAGVGRDQDRCARSGTRSGQTLMALESRLLSLRARR